MKRLCSCIACGGNNIHPFLIGRDPRYDIPGEYPYDKCDSCGTWFLNPFPSIKETPSFYPTQYYSFHQHSNNLTHRFSLLAYRSLYATTASIFSRIIFSPLKMLTRGTVIFAGGRILDVGSGSGAFLQKMQELGMTVQGVEFSSEGAAEANAHGIPTKAGALQHAKLAPSSYDVITINHVLEHVTDPNADLARMHALLKSHGTLIVGVPVTDGLAARLFKTHWPNLDAPRHLVLMPARTLEKAITDCGFRVIRRRYVGMPFALTSGLANIFGKKSTVSRILCSRFLNKLLLPFAFALNVLHLGDQIEIWATKD